MNSAPETVSEDIKPVEGRFVWKGPDVDYENDATRFFSEEDIGEIDKALIHLKRLGNLDFPEITPSTFPLDTFRETLSACREDLRTGLGFLLFRGFPVDRYSQDDLGRIFYGMGTYLGTPMPQSYQGDLLGHVMDVSDIEQNDRGYRRGGKLSMHTDAGGIAALMCLRAAASGGASRIASTAALHNELLKTRPDLVSVLYEGFLQRSTEKDAEYGDGQNLTNGKIPVFMRDDGEFTCRYIGGFLRRAIEAGDVSEGGLELEAVDALDNLAGLPEFYLDMFFKEGDMQFLNNNLILHNRTDYTDRPELDQRRHLLRIWLEVPGWPEHAFDAHNFKDQDIWIKRRTHLGETSSAYFKKLEEMRIHGEKFN